MNRRRSTFSFLASLFLQRWLSFRFKVRWALGFGCLTLGLLGADTLVSAESPTSKTESEAPLIVPGGGLDAHERAGGHMLERHVGKTAEQLKRRLESDSHISAASSFTDRPTADRAVAAAIQANRKRIQNWVKGGSDRLVVTYRSPTPVGISMGRSSAKPKDAYSVRLVLVRDERFPGKWRILTGYPEL